MLTNTSQVAYYKASKNQPAVTTRHAQVGRLIEIIQEKMSNIERLKKLLSPATPGRFSAKKQHRHLIVLGFAKSQEHHTMNATATRLPYPQQSAATRTADETKQAFIYCGYQITDEYDHNNNITSANVEKKIGNIATSQFTFVYNRMTEKTFITTKSALTYRLNAAPDTTITCILSLDTDNLVRAIQKAENTLNNILIRLTAQSQPAPLRNAQHYHNLSVAVAQAMFGTPINTGDMTNIRISRNQLEDIMLILSDLAGEGIQTIHLPESE